jgi:hypothetical protein
MSSTNNSACERPSRQASSHNSAMLILGQFLSSINDAPEFADKRSVVLLQAKLYDVVGTSFQAVADLPT